MTIQAAGILILAKDGRALFLKRGAGGDNPGEWCFPGGRIEAGETAIEAAVRETKEESGFAADQKALTPWTRRVANRETTAAAPTPGPGEVGVNAAGGASLPIVAPPGEAIVAEGEVDFSTFLLRDAEQFVPDIDASGEHVAYAWAPLDQPPEPLHPGCRVALERFGMNELDVARAIVAGELTSPQRYQNLWLFKIRITGTAVSYRPQHDEFVYRRPENYLTDDFLARSNGLPVIVQHPQGDKLDGKEFSDRIIGTVFIPFIEGDEVWAIAKVFNEAAGEAMTHIQMSTSPGVIFAAGTNSKFTMEDGSTLNVEGDPALLDHLAICPRGVWDKGGEAAGVESIEARKDDAMTEDERARKDAEDKAEQERKDSARKDADDKMASMFDAFTKACDSITAMGGRMDAMSARMDAMEGGVEETAADKARKDAEKAEADEKARKDAETKAEEEKRADEARKDSDDTKARIAAVEAALPRHRTDAEANVIANAWTASNQIMTAFGDSASTALPGEDAMSYRRRLLLPMQTHSSAWKEIDLSKLDENAFGVAETQIRKDAMAAAMSPSSVGGSGLREIRRTLSSGHTEVTWAGHPKAWMNPFSGSAQRATGEFMTRLGGRS